MKKLHISCMIGLLLVMCLMLAACEAGEALVPASAALTQTEGRVLSAPTDFEMDPVTGEYSFQGTDPDAAYYIIRIYPVTDGRELVDYTASSSRINGKGTGLYTGVVDLPAMGWGSFRVKLITYSAAGSQFTNPDPVSFMVEYGVGLTLERPEMLAMSSGNQVELVVDWATLSDYYDYEYLPEMKFSFYSDPECTAEVYSDTVDLGELGEAIYGHPMGYSWGTSYSEPSLHYYTANGELTGFGPYVGSQTYCFINDIYTYTLDPGTYYVTCQAIAKLDYTNDSQPSTAVQITLIDQEPTEEFTVATTELWVDPPMSDIASIRSATQPDRVDFCGDQPLSARIVD